jgi:hypothetical protein
VRILLDHCAPKRLRGHMPAHVVQTTREMGWDKLANGDLLDNAQATFDVFISVDQNIQYQQTIAGRPIALIVFVTPDTRLAALLPLIPELDRILLTVLPGNVYEVRPPPPFPPPTP